MDQGKLIQLMNEDLELEYRSIVQYVQHLAIATGAEFQAILDELRSHVAQELNHALVLAEQVDFLGGVPSVRVPKIMPQTDTRQALEDDLSLEEAQLARYRDRVAQAEELRLFDVAEALRPLLQETQDHVRELQTALGR